MAAWSVGKQTITVIPRTGSRDTSTGKWGITDGTPVTVNATVNPVPGDVLLTLPEGERTEKNLRVLTEYEMTMTDDYDQTVADHVVIRGERYEVRDVQIYEKVIPHFEYRVRRVRPKPSAFGPGFDEPAYD